MNSQKLALVLLFPLLLGSCSPTIFRFDDEFYSSTDKGFVELSSYDTIASYEDADSSFPVYILLSTCSTCRKFTPILTEYLDTYNLKCFKIDIAVVNQTSNKLHDVIKYAPAVALYNKGNVVTFLDAASSNDKAYFESVDNLANWFNQYVDVTPLSA